jgi:hypothetical protein
MPTGTFEYANEAERLAIETAIAFVTELRQLALTAPDGQVLSACEGQALTQGRDLLRSTVQQAVQARVQSAEVKGGPHVSARARARSASSGAVSAKC